MQACWTRVLGSKAGPAADGLWNLGRTCHLWALVSPLVKGESDTGEQRGLFQVPSGIQPGRAPSPGARGWVWSVPLGPVLGAATCRVAEESTEGASLPLSSPQGRLCLSSPTPAKVKEEDAPPPHTGNPRRGVEPLICEPGTVISYLPREQGGRLALTVAREMLSWQVGGAAFSSPVFPARSLSFLFTPFFLSPWDREKTGRQD